MSNENLNRPGIYRIVNAANGKVYVGSAVNFRKRWIEHRRRLRKNDHHSRPLQAAWNKHGEHVFTFEVLEDVCDPCLLLAREQEWLDKMESGRHYNVCLVAGSTLGRKMSDETRKRISAAKIGKPNNQLGRKRTAEQIERIAAGQRGKTMSPDAIAKTASGNRGQKRSADVRAKMAEAARNRDPSWTVSMAEKQRGKVMSAESRQKMREAWVKRRESGISDETRIKLSITSKARWERRKANV